MRRPGISEKDQRVEAADFFQQLNPNSVLSDLLDHQITLSEARLRLSSGGPLALLLAGRLDIELATYEAVSDEQAFDYFDSAAEAFTMVERTRLFARSGKTDPIATRARVERILCPSNALMTIDHRLPSLELAQTTYKQTVGASHDLLVEFDSSKNSIHPKQRKHFVGLLAELAVLMMLQRFAINEIGCDTWFPQFSLLREDRSNSKGSSLNHAWDINVWSRVDHSRNLDYKIQVKNGKFGQHSKQRPDVDDIISVFVNQDLAIDSEEDIVASRIIDGCFFELQSEACPKVSETLDARQEKLLTVLDT